MPEIKHNFTRGKMNKDLDERLIPNGEYRDAMNIQVSTSEGADIGAVQNILGNNLISNQDIIPDDSYCIGSIADEKNDALYWLITQGNQFSYNNFNDGVFQSKDMILQYKKGVILPVLVDLSNIYILMPGGGNPSTGDLPISTLAGWNMISVGDTISGITDAFSTVPLTQESFTVLSINSTNQTINIGNYVNASPAFVNAQQGEIYFQLNEASSTLNFSIKPNLNETYGEHQLITGINIIDDMLFWTDNYSEPKKINIPRCIEGTNPNGQQHTLFINHDRSFTILNNPILIREEHITVIRKAPTLAPQLNMLSDRPGNTFGKIGDGVGGNQNIPVPVFSGLTTNDKAVLKIESINNMDLNYVVGDILVLKEGATQSQDFPIESSTVDIRVTINAIDNTTWTSLSGNPIHHCNCTILSVRSNLSVSANIFGVDLDKSHERLYELKFPRFSTRFKYIDGEYSSFGPFSEVAFIPGIYDYFPNKGYNLGMENKLTELTLRRVVPSNVPDGVVQIDILYKESNSPNVYVVDSIKKTDPWAGQGGNPWIFNEYVITKDIIHAALPSNQLLRLWDNVPRKALAQDIVGNRIVYGNYLQGFDILDYSNIQIKSSFKVFLESRIGEATYKSIKSIRNYQLGIVYSDEYNRQTPILTDSSGAVAVSRLDADKTNQIVVRPKNNPPYWAKHHKFYIKETSSEYYNLSLDRFFNAEDGNIWLSFPSNDRNKIDLETSLYLKKKYNSDEQETTLNKYKVIDIKNEAPEYIQTRRVTVGKVSNDDDDLFQANSPFVGNIWPIRGEDQFRIKHTALDDTILENFHLKQTSFYGNPSPKNPLYVKFVSTSAGVQGRTTGWHEIDSANKKGHALTGTGSYRIKLKEKFDEEADWMNTGTATVPVLSTAATEGDIVLHMGQDIVQNKSVFQGRFFVKILRDSFIQEAIIRQGAFQNIQIVSKADCYYLKDYDHEDLSVTPVTSGSGVFTLPSKADQQIEVNDINANGFDPYHLGNFNTTAVPDGKAVLNTAYWGRQIWYEIYKRFEVIESKWFIDDAFSAGEEPLWGHHGKTQYLEMVDDPWTSTLYGGYHSESANLWTLYHNQGTSPGGTFATNIGNPTNTPPLNHGPMLTNKQDYEYYTEGSGVKDYTIDISYLGPGEYDLTDYEGDPTAFFAFNYGFAGVYFPTPYADWWSILAGFDPEARAFADHLMEGTQIRFTNDPDQIVYTLKKVKKFYKQNYAEAKQNHWYPFAKWGSGDVSDDCGGPQAQMYDQCIEHGHEFFNNPPWNRRITYRLTLEAPNAGNVIGYNGYTPLISGSIGSDTWDAPTADTYPCGIEIVTADYIGSGDDPSVPFPENPAVFETQPKENVDLDLYHEISDYIPLTLDGNGYEFAPVGSIVTVPSASGALGYATVVGWDGTVVELSSIVNDCNIGQYALFYFQRPDGSYTTAEYRGLSNPVQGPCNTSFFVGFYDTGTHKIHDNKVGLGWHNCYSFGNGVESNRIRDTYNSSIIDKGPRVSSILEKTYTEDRRKYGLIYSGLYNSVSDMNNLNQFIQAEKITKDINPTYGSIQKLHTRDTDLVTLCEDKVLRILANKDAVYNADGNPQLTATERVLGQTVPFIGEFGISKNPESFASESYRSYFTDKQRGTAMRLSKDGLTPISMHGMKDWFRDNLKLSTKLVGSYDDRNDEYNITLDSATITTITSCDTTTTTAPITVSFKEDVKGWVSFKSFIPENAISCANDYFTILNGKLYKHYDENVDRNTFYGSYTDSSIKVVLNDSPGSVKSFHTLDYEGSQSQIIPLTHYNATGGLTLENEYYNLTAKDGWYVESVVTDLENGSLDEFIKKEGKWFNYFHGKSITTDINGFVECNYDTGSFAIQGIGYADSIECPECPPAPPCIDGCTNPTACNYDPLATCDDGSCILPDGCTDDTASNFDPLANCDDGSCTYAPIYLGYNCLNGTCVGTNWIAQYSSLTACQTTCGQLPSWDCSGLGIIVDGITYPPYTCYDPMNGSGAHSSLAACQSACVAAPIPPSFECSDSGIVVDGVAIAPWTCYDPMDGSGYYSVVNGFTNPLQDCQSDCMPGPSWYCDGSNCIDPGDGSGVYPSLAACQSAQASGLVTNCWTGSWDCVSGVCLDPGTGNGLYSTLATCQSICSSLPSWDCVNGVCVDPGNGSGVYPTSTACTAGCAPVCSVTNAVFNPMGGPFGTVTFDYYFSTWQPGDDLMYHIASNTFGQLIAGSTSLGTFPGGTPPSSWAGSGVVIPGVTTPSFNLVLPPPQAFHMIVTHVDANGNMICFQTVNLTS